MTPNLVRLEFGGQADVHRGYQFVWRNSRPVSWFQRQGSGGQMMTLGGNGMWFRASRSKILAVGFLIMFTVGACTSPEPEHGVASEIIAFGLRQLTPTITGDDQTAYASNPAVSVDGSRIAFSRGSGIAVMNVDGTEQKTIADRGGLPSFSPDGSKIVFG